MVDLLQEGIDSLRLHPEIQCVGSLKRGSMKCAEGVFAQVLIDHFPERFSWVANGEQEEFRIRDQEKVSEFTGRLLSFHALLPEHWNLLHPNGYRIAAMVAAAFGYTHIANVNDHGHIPFLQIADKFQYIKDRVGMEPHCDNCGQKFVSFNDANRLCMACELAEMERKAAIEREFDAAST